MPRNKDLAAGFIEPMQCLQVDRLPEGPDWIYEVKLDGYRAQAICDGKTVRLLSRNGLSLAARFPTVAIALSHALPNGSVVDGELVALGPDGKPSFSLIQNSATSDATFVFYAFDLLRLDHEDLILRPLSERRDLLRNWLLTSETVQLSETFQVPAGQMLASVREHGLEGVVAKRLSSWYEQGKRTGAWVKMRVELAQEFVIGGYTPGTHGFDALQIGFYRGQELHFCASVRNGFVPASRRALFPRLQPLATGKCPFVNLPEASAGRWGQGLTAAKMQNCVWLRPETVAQFRFLEWTPADHLRHVSFVGLREDKDASQVVKEGDAIPPAKVPNRKPPQAVPKEAALRRTRP